MHEIAPNPWSHRIRAFFSARNRAIRIVLTDGFIILLLFATAELVIRNLDSRYTQHLFDQQFTGSKPIEMNTEGYRGPLVLRSDSPEEIRILALGDSITFGSGVHWNETWPMRLGDRIAQSTGRPVTVINTAVPATDVDQMRFALDELVATHDPHAVVLLLSGNAVSLGWIRRDELDSMPFNGFLDRKPPKGQLAIAKQRAKRGVKEFSLPSFGSLNTQRAMYWLGLLRHDIKPNDPAGVMLAHGWIQGELDPTRSEQAWDVLQQDLEELKAATDALGLPLIASYAPPRFTLTDRFIDNEKAVPKSRLTIDAPQRALDLLGQLGISATDVRPFLLNARATAQSFTPLYIQFDYTHFDRTGHDAVAEAFAELLLEVVAP